MKLHLSHDPQLPLRIRADLQRPVFGERQKCELAPELAYGRHRGPATHAARSAAVMIAILKGPAGWSIPLTLRTDHLPEHAGQISLPGGRLETGESEWLAAERELQEELGIERGRLQPLGQLSSVFIFASQHRVRPCIGFSDQPMDLHPSPDEVAEVISLPIALLVDSRAKQTRLIRRGAVEFSAPGYCVDNHFVWGATAIILAQFARTLLRLQTD